MTTEAGFSSPAVEEIHFHTPRVDDCEMHAMNFIVEVDGASDSFEMTQPASEKNARPNLFIAQRKKVCVYIHTKLCVHRDTTWSVDAPQKDTSIKKKKKRRQRISVYMDMEL